MKKSSNYDEEMKEILELIEQGFKLNDISEIMGIPRGTIACRLSRAKSRGLIDKVDGRKKKNSRKPAEKLVIDTQQTVAKEKTLKDFEPRDLFKHLYDLGYRIDDKGVYVMVKQYVNLRSVINE